MTLAGTLTDAGWSQSKLDPNLFYWRDQDGGVIATLPIHVDDSKGRCRREYLSEVRTQLCELFNIGEFEVLEAGMSKDFLGQTVTELEDGVKYDQSKYVNEILGEVPVSKARGKQRDAICTSEELSQFRTTLGQTSWTVINTRPEYAYESSAGASSVNELKIDNINRLNKVVRCLKTNEGWIFMPKLSSKVGVKVVAICDGGEGESDPDVYTKGQSGYLVGIAENNGPGVVGKICPVVPGRSTKCKRVTHASFDVETITAVTALDGAMAIGLLIEEWYQGPEDSRRQRLLNGLEGVDQSRWQVPIELYSDCKSLIQNVENLKIDTRMTKRRKTDIADLKEAKQCGELAALVHIDGKYNPLDCATKKRVRCLNSIEILRKLLRTGWWEPILK